MSKSERVSVLKSAYKKMGYDIISCGCGSVIAINGCNMQFIYKAKREVQ